MSKEKKKKYDMNSPEAKALIDEIVHGTFMKEGTMVAFPTCFPGATVPIPGDESHITALSMSPEGIVYGGTSGRSAHVFVGMFHGVTGIVFDRGTVEGADHCPAICCCSNDFVACVNGPGGGRLISGGLQGLPFDLIQEWGFDRAAFRELARSPDGPIVHAVASKDHKSVIGITAHSLFVVDVQSGKLEVRGEVAGAGRIAMGSTGDIYGLDAPGHLWKYDTTGTLRRRAVPLADGDWNHVSLMWAADPHERLLYTADAGGQVFSLDAEGTFSPALGKTPLAPVGPMAVTHDGRLFGFCGADLARMFCYDPRDRQLTNLGVAVSVIERRRYGYVFGDAVLGRDGQIFFGEDDDLGHLWLYFPRIVDSRRISANKA